MDNSFFAQKNMHDTCISHTHMDDILLVYHARHNRHLQFRIMTAIFAHFVTPLITKYMNSVELGLYKIVSSKVTSWIQYLNDISPEC